jgi:hypothetical protein
MNKALPAILIFGGIAIGAISWLGYQAANTKSQDQILMEAMQAERQRQEDLIGLKKLVLTVPETCNKQTTGFIFAVCGQEPDAGKDWPDWTHQANSAEQTCMLDSFHVTNAHSRKLQGKDYTPETPPTNRISSFISDVCSASLFTDGINYGETDKPANILIKGYFVDRADSSVKPTFDYLHIK